MLYPLDDLFLLRSLGAVLGASLQSVSNACGIESSSDDMVSYTREVLNSAASDEYHAVLLEVMTDTRDVSGYFDTISQTYSGNLSQG